MNITFHSSFTDCQVSSDDRIRLLTIQGDPVAPVISQPLTACLGLLPDLLTAGAASGGSNNFLYQWQESPDGLTWSDIPGATGLTCQPPVLTAATWFRMVATDNGLVSCGNPASAPRLLLVTDCLSRHYRTTASGEWHDRTIWETSADGFTWGGIAWTHPTDQMLSTTLRNGHLVTLESPVTVARVTVEPGGAVTVEEGATLTNGDPSGASGFVIHSSETAHGSLIVNGAFNGNLTFRKYYDPTRWTIMASPLKVTNSFAENAPSINFYAPENNYDFAWYREKDNYGWFYYPTLPASLDPGKGYILHPAKTNNPDEGFITFSGVVNGAVNDTVSPAVYCTSARHGWNAVGNPFTSAIGITASSATTENFLTRNAGILEDSYAAIYVWNETGVYDGSQQYYKAIGNSGYNFPGFSYYGGSDPAYLQSGQGFLVNVKATARAIFSTAMQVHRPLVQLKASTIAGVDPPKESPARGRNGWQGMTLAVRQGHRERQTVIAFHHSMTTGLDKTYDAGLFPSDDFRVYTRLVSGVSGADLEIQCLPDKQYEELVIPVGLDLPAEGEITFSTSGVMLPDQWIPLLEDRLNEVTVPLVTDEEGYQVTLQTGTSGTGRFFLRFGEITATNTSRFHPIANPANHPGSYTVFQHENTLYIKGKVAPNTYAALFDMTGKLIIRSRLEVSPLNEVTLPSVKQGIYLLQISGKGKPVTIKVSVR